MSIDALLLEFLKQHYFFLQPKCVYYISHSSKGVYSEFMKLSDKLVTCLFSHFRGFSLLRIPLPQFLSYVRASYSDFGLKYFFFSSNKATNPDNNSPKEKTESTDDEGGPAKTTLNPIYIPPKTSKVISSIMEKNEMAKNIH